MYPHIFVFSKGTKIHKDSQPNFSNTFLAIKPVILNMNHVGNF